MRFRAFLVFLIAMAAVEAQTPPSVRGYWDDVFRSGKVQFNKNASKLLQYAVLGRKPGFAVDLGMGEGRNAVFLAEKGWQVTGVDISSEAVKQAKARAAAAHVAVEAITDDLDHYEIGRMKWDLIVLLYMHAWFHQSKHNVPEIIAAALKPGGLLVIEGYAGDEGDFQTNELLRAFDKLKIVHYEDVVDEADWAPGATSRVIRFIAERP
jgi:SAM-dependent methyltransferase